MDGVPTEPALALRRLINGYQVSQAIHAAATLGVADLLLDGPLPAAALAARAGADPDALHRLLRALAAVNLFHELSEGTFALAPLGEALCRGAPGSCAAWARLAGRPAGWSAWGALTHGIRTGENPFQHVHGTDAWTWRAARPEEGAIFDAAMRESSTRIAAAFAQVAELGRFRHAVDVGGGDGTLLTEILGRFPALSGTLLDQPGVVAACRCEDFGARLRIVAGDFFTAVPEGGDAYILKFILHDWDDARALSILRNCARAMAPAARLVVIERLLAPPNQGMEGKLSDLNMLVNLGGRERTREEFLALLAKAGFALQAVRIIDHQVCAMEAGLIAAR